MNLQTNEKVYILEQLSAEWYRGRTRSGCEGIFPINYIDVKVPLVEQNAKSKPLRVRCLYNFSAEYDGDLTLKVGVTSYCCCNILVLCLRFFSCVYGYYNSGIKHFAYNLTDISVHFYLLLR